MPTGEFAGRLYRPRCGTAVSSSKVRLNVEREETVAFPLIFIGKGERESGDICPVVALGGTGNRIGRAGDVALGALGLEDMADAETGVVCGSLMPLRNGLNNQDGVSFDVKEAREELVVSRRRSPLLDEVAVETD